jgi:hypothetical protein
MDDSLSELSSTLGAERSVLHEVMQRTRVRLCPRSGSGQPVY